MAQNSLTGSWLALPAADTTMAATRPLVVTMHWILRIGAACCFIGHGAFGILTLAPWSLIKGAWVSYFAVVGIDRAIAVSLMPWVGAMDIALGILMLIVPLRFVMVWMTFWGIWTALLRPLAGENPYEFIERAGNYGAPFALLVLSGFGTNVRSWFAEIARPALTERKANTLDWLLRGIVALTLIGHGAFGPLVVKNVWYSYLGVFGLNRQEIIASNLFALVGWAQIVLGLAVLVLPFRRVVPLRYLLLVIPPLKIGFEMLRGPVNEPYWWFEVIERAGTYTAPLALFVLYFWIDRVRAGAVAERGHSEAATT